MPQQKQGGQHAGAVWSDEAQFFSRQASGVFAQRSNCNRWSWGDMPRSVPDVRVASFCATPAGGTLSHMRKEAGFTLVWVLMLLALLGSLAGVLMQSAAGAARAARSVAAGNLREIGERNVLSYAERLLEANAATLLRSLPAPSAGAQPLAERLQAEVSRWCERDPDGAGAGRVRVYFTARACGVPLPSGVAVPVPTLLSEGSGLWQLEAPFVLVSPAPERPVVRRGTFRARYGAAPASVYALLAPGNLTLGEGVQVRGDVHADGGLTLLGDVRVQGTLSASGCVAVAPGCVGTRSVTLGDRTVSVMDLTPSPGHPEGFSGFLALGQSGETGGA